MQTTAQELNPTSIRRTVMLVFLVILFGVVLVLALQWLGPGRRSDVSGCKEGWPNGRQTVSDGLQDLNRAATQRRRLLRSLWETTRAIQRLSQPGRWVTRGQPIRKPDRNFIAIKMLPA